MAEVRWKTRWPRGPDMRQWMRCLVSKAAAIDDVAERVKYTTLAIEQLTKRDCFDEAMTQLERLLRSLPRDDGLHRVMVLELGAKLHLKAGNMRKMEEYLQRILATKPLHTRKCDRGWEVENVRKFKLFHGLLDPLEATDENQRIEASFNMSMRQVDELIDENSREAALSELARAEKMIPRMPGDWRRRVSYEDVLDRYVRLKDRSAAQRLARRLSPQERHDALDGEKLWEIGLHKEALLRIDDDLTEAMEEFASFNPNVHMFGADIKDLLLFLIKIGKEDLARQWLARVLAEGKSWQFHERGFASAALFHSLAEVVTKLDGVDAAEQLLSLAMSDSRNEKRSCWRGQEVGSVIELLANAGRLDKALEIARTIRSPARRRDELAGLLARGRQWKDLRKVLCEAKTPLEAAELCWSVRFGLEPAGTNEE